MSSRQTTFLACSACLIAASFANLLAGDPAILFPGEFHGDEVSATSGETWLALVQGDGGLDRVASVVLEVDPVVDDMVDEGGTVTGRRVSVVGDHLPALVFLRDVPGVKQGSVETVARNTVLEPNSSVALALGGGPTNLLELRCRAPRVAREWEEVRCDLVFSRGVEEQVLKTYSASYHDGEFEGLGNSASTAVVWAGDLNGDGLLDVVVDLTDHYNVALPTLFLSPGSGESKLLTWVADHTSFRC